MASDGWRSQSPWLKVLLLVSLTLIAIGVYRCSMELKPRSDVPKPVGTTEAE
ncbi:MAG: hypothetical protein JXB46_07210 [Candidatus Eisenbacteria bacterium]|nr:hypothetical protein [Candidatus Eisenbacteria bacterium]